VVVSKHISLSILTLFLLTLSPLATGYPLPHANTACHLSVSNFLASRFPLLSNYVNLDNYTVISSNLNYTDLKILVFKWVSRGVSIGIQVTEETCEITRFEVTVDSRYLNESNLNNLLNELETGVEKLFSDVKDLVSNTSNARIIGGQLVVNDTPIYFIDPNYVTATPALVRYFVYPSPPIVIYTFINYFPAVKKLLTQVTNFNLSEEEAIETLKNKLNITEYRGVTRSYVILYGVLRPAYIIAITPYKNVAVLADNGEVLTQKTATNTQATPEDNQLIMYLGLTLILAGSAIAVTYIFWLKRRRLPLRFTT